MHEGEQSCQAKGFQLQFSLASSEKDTRKQKGEVGSKQRTYIDVVDRENGIDSLLSIHHDCILCLDQTSPLQRIFGGYLTD